MEHPIIKKIIKKGLFLTMLLGLLALSSCYNDNYQTLYPSGTCDTTHVTYAKDVWPVINANCTGCHSGAAPSGNVALENYNDVVVIAKNGKLLGSIRFDPGFSPMPKGGPKLNSCDIAKIEKWVNDGTPNN